MRMPAYQEIFKKWPLSRKTSVLDIFKSSSGTRTSPLLLLDIQDDDPDDPPTVPEKRVLLKFSLFFFFHFKFLVHFRCVRKIAKSNYLLRHVYLSVCQFGRPPAHMELRVLWFPLNGFSWNLKSIFRKYVTKIQV